MKVNSKKRGFTIVELVVAMTIIVIVSATAIALINNQNTIHLRTMQTIEATNMAENAIECFRYAVENPKDNDTGEDDVVAIFEEMYEKTGVTLNNVKNESDEPIKGHYEVKASNMTVTITIEENTLTFIATDITDSSKVILEESYMK